MPLQRVLLSSPANTMYTDVQAFSYCAETVAVECCAVLSWCCSCIQTLLVHQKCLLQHALGCNHSMSGMLQAFVKMLL